METKPRNHRKGLFLFASSISLLTGSALISWGEGMFGARLPYNIYGSAVSFLMAVVFFYFLLKEVYHDEAFSDLPKDATDDERENRSKIQYNKIISYLGISIILLSVVDAVLLSGYLHTKTIAIPFSALHGVSESAQATDSLVPAVTMNGKTRFNPSFGGRILILSMLLAILGSLFFTANTLNDSRKKNKPLFSKYEFWSGLWFRMGESCLFVFVLFVVLCSDEKYYQDFIHWLPALSLMMGMFVKSGEHLIFGVAERLLEMAKGLVPGTTKKNDEPGPEDEPGPGNVLSGGKKPDDKPGQADQAEATPAEAEATKPDNASDPNRKSDAKTESANQDKKPNSDKSEIPDPK